MSNTVRLFVHLPPASRHMLAKHDFPVLVYVDVDPRDKEPRIPAAIEVTAVIEGVPASISYETPRFNGFNGFNGFNRIVRIRDLPHGQRHCLYITAACDGLETACFCCPIQRDPSKLSKQKGQGKQMGYGGAPIIVYPINGATVPNNFTTYGYVTPSTSIVTAWVADSGGNTYPGMAVAPPPTYDWAFAFAGLPVGAGGAPVQYTLYAQANGLTSPVSIMVGGAFLCEEAEKSATEREGERDGRRAAAKQYQTSK